MNIGCVYSVEDVISSEKVLPSFSAIPFGISYIATALKVAGFRTKMIVITPQSDISYVISKFVGKYNPALFCLTAVTSQYSLICTVAKTIKKINSSIYIILGGHHASLNPNETIRKPYFDAICIGEGENAVVEYADQIKRNQKPRGINNLWIRRRDGERIEKNPQDPFIQALDELPNIDRKMWDNWVADNNRMHSVLVGRGCPNKCTYCSNHALSKLSKGKYVRFRSHQKLIDELNEIVEYYPSVSSIFLEAETLGVNLKYTYEMCDYLSKFNSNREKKISFGANFAATRKVISNEKLLKELKKANFDFINIGLESGSERIRSEVLKRPKYTNRDIITFCNLVKRYGIKINLFVLMGIPTETLLDLRKTYSCTRECDPQHVFLSIFYPYPGTVLHSTAREMKLLKKDIVDQTRERRRPVLDLPGFSKRQIKREYLLFPYKVYKGKKPVHMILALILRNYFNMYPILNSGYRIAVNHKSLRNLPKTLNLFGK